MRYQVGDEVLWVLGNITGAALFIGYPKDDKAGKVLIIASAANVGTEIDAHVCHPTGQSYPALGAEFRQRFAQEYPGRLLGNP
jgi:hypothetical protein